MSYRIIQSKVGFTVVEISIVILVGTLILLPTVSFIMTSQKNAQKGFDRLHTLTTARLVLERVQRDLKAFCYDKTHGIKFNTSTLNPSFSFPIFPTQRFAFQYSGKRNPVNIVTYTFYPQTSTLERVEKVHPLLRRPGEPDTVREVLAQNIIDFSILDRPFLGMFYFEIHVKCQIFHPLRKETTHLRGSVRSEYEASLVRNKFQVPNRLSVLDFPP